MMSCSIPECQKEIETMYKMTGKCYRIDGKPVCRKCFYEMLGKFVEKNPIGGPMIIYGANLLD